MRRIAVGVGIATALALPESASVLAQTTTDIRCIAGVPCLGTPLDDSITGTNRADQIRAFFGTDEVKARGGADTVYGDDSSDIISGDEGPDRLFGGREQDSIFGRGGADRIFGGKAGARCLDKVGPCYELSGGRGDDLVDGGPGDDRRLSGDGGADRLIGGPGRDGISGGAGNDFIDAARRETDPGRRRHPLLGPPEGVHCGAGKDRAIVNRSDSVDPSCERVKVVPNP